MSIAKLSAMHLVPANVNGAIRQGQVNEVKGLSKFRRIPFRAVLGM